MPKEPNSHFDNRADEAEYRRRQEAKNRRRKQRYRQKLMLLGAFAVAGVLVIVCLWLIIGSLFPSEAPPSSSVTSSSAAPPPAVSSGPGYSWPVAADPAAWNLLLINRSNPMPDGYNPALVPVSDVGHLFHGDAAQDLLDMVAACNAVDGHSLRIESANRGPQTQADKRKRALDALVAGGMPAADAEAAVNGIEPEYPLSDHQTALGLNFVTDVVSDTLPAFAETPEYAWLLENAHNYGFVLRFPQGKEAITGIQYQPYHWRYVGKTDAPLMREHGICLEEYLDRMPGDESGDSSAAASLPLAGVSGSNL